jgi:hypothetical protein
MLAIKYNQAISEEPSLKAMEKEREGERERISQETGHLDQKHLLALTAFYLLDFA